MGMLTANPKVPGSKSLAMEWQSLGQSCLAKNKQCLEWPMNELPTRYTGTSSPLGFWAAVAINMGCWGEEGMEKRGYFGKFWQDSLFLLDSIVVKNNCKISNLCVPRVFK
jgi:hypothetical protein